MSKKSRIRKQRRVESMVRRAEQQAALKGAIEGPGRASIGLRVLERLDRLRGAEHMVAPPVKPQQAHPQVKLLPQDKAVTLPQPQTSEPWPSTWPLCPKSCNPIEWRRALEAKDYYELKQIEDDGKKPWFQYPKFPYQYSEFVYCTPEMMDQLLKHMPVNRGMKQAHADAIARDVAAERWIQSHESIAVNTLGNMHDGQHRALGVKKAGRGWPIYITWNVPPEAIYVVDSGDKRKINEKLSLLFPDSKLTSKTTPICRAMMWGLTARGIRYSESEIAEFAMKHHATILWVATNLRQGYRADLQAVIGKALLWWGEAVIGPFVKRIKSVQFDGEGDPAKTLYLWVQAAKKEGRRASYVNPIVYYKKTLGAIYAYVHEKESKKLYQKEKDVFEWLPNWEVPATAPCKGNVFLETQTEEQLAAALADHDRLAETPGEEE